MVLSFDRWIGKIAVVTGASSGIGAAICEKLVSEGVKVVGVARRSENIDHIATKLLNEKGKLYSYKADISKEEELLEVFKWVKNNLGPISILVNNAGIAQKTSLYDGDTEVWKRILDVNVIALCVATREVVRNMRENDIAGHIIHINSIAGHKVPNIPAFNIYPASKFAVTALTESLRLELNNLSNQIKVTSISPGATDTEFVKASQFEIEDGQLSKAFSVTLKSEDVADAVLYVLSTPPHVQIHELTIKPINEPF